MISGLKEAIFDASTQLGSAACYAGNHRWVSVGGRGCPQNLTSRCSQSVYVCAECGDYDYGEPGGPGATDCRKYCQHRNFPGQSIVSEDTE